MDHDGRANDLRHTTDICRPERRVGSIRWASQGGRNGNRGETGDKDGRRGTCDGGRSEVQAVVLLLDLVSVLLRIDSDCAKGAGSAARTRYGYTRTFSRGWLRVVARPVPSKLQNSRVSARSPAGANARPQAAAARRQVVGRSVQDCTPPAALASTTPSASR